MPDNDTSERIQRMAEAMNPFGQLLDQMTETAKMWMSAAADPDTTVAERSVELRNAAQRTAELSGAWIEPLRKLSEEHERFADEMATWAERHRQFAEEVSEWADAHHAVAERLSGWTKPFLEYAELVNKSMTSAVASMYPPERDGGTTP